MPFGNPRILGQKTTDFLKIFCLFLPFMGQKVVFWVKKRCFGVFWTKCEVADLKHRKKPRWTIEKRYNRCYYPHMALETPQTALLNVALFL